MKYISQFVSSNEFFVVFRTQLMSQITVLVLFYSPKDWMIIVQECLRLDQDLSKSFVVFLFPYNISH